MSNLPLIPVEQQEYRIQFGHAVQKWMQLNNLSQDYIGKASKLAGLSGGVHNSQISLLCRGILDPKPQFFVAFGELNQLIDSSDFLFIPNDKHRAVMLNATPFINSCPFSGPDQYSCASDFFSMYIGEMPIHSKYLAPLEDVTSKKMLKLTKSIQTLTKDERQSLRRQLEQL